MSRRTARPFHNVYINKAAHAHRHISHRSWTKLLCVGSPKLLLRCDDGRSLQLPGVIQYLLHKVLSEFADGLPRYLVYLLGVVVSPDLRYFTASPL